MENDEKSKIKYLIELKGVNIPTASAILSVINPDKYPIIDERCIQSLNSLGIIKWDKITLDNWINYLIVIRDLGEQFHKSAREIEKGLFAFNRIKLDSEYKNLYK